MEVCKNQSTSVFSVRSTLGKIEITLQISEALEEVFSWKIISCIYHEFVHGFNSHSNLAWDFFQEKNLGTCIQVLLFMSDTESCSNSAMHIDQYVTSM